MSYDKVIYDQAESEIARRKFISDAENKKRRLEIEAKIPEIKEINARLTQTIVEITSLIIRKNPDIEGNINKIKERNLQGQKMIAQLLTANGYPSDYLEDRYFCHKCSDSGYVDGKRCECLIRVLNRLSIERLNETANMPECDFEHFSLEYYRDKEINGISCYDQMAANLDYCLNYADNFSLSSDSILLYGKTGVGKTHLSLAIAKRVAQKGFTVAYGSLINYLNIIEREHFSKKGEKEVTDTMSLLINSELLVLDDLGSEFNTGFYESAIYNIINSRMNLGLPTIISTNLDTNDLQQKYNDRIISRIFCVYKTLYCLGVDIRQIKRLANRN